MFKHPGSKSVILIFTKPNTYIVSWVWILFSCVSTTLLQNWILDQILIQTLELENKVVDLRGVVLLEDLKLTSLMERFTLVGLT